MPAGWLNRGNAPTSAAQGSTLWRALVFFSVFLASIGASALDPDRLPSQYLLERFGRDNGLPSDTVWVTRQGPRGYLWIGTRAGLVRFDGTRFTIFNELTHDAFRANDVRDLAWSPTGDLWIATYGGGVVVMRENGFETFGEDDGLAGDIVYDIHHALDGSVWFATGSGISRLLNGELTTWDENDGLSDNRVLKIAEASNGDLWFGGLTNGLNYFDGTSLRAIGIGEGLDSLKVHLLASDPEHGVIAGTASGSVFRGAERGMLHRLPWSGELPIEDVFVDSDGNRWLGSYGRGLWRLNANDGKEPFVFGEESESSIVFGLDEDASGNLWVSTSNGLYRIRDSAFLQLGKYEGLADATFVVTGDGAGNLWAGTEGHGLFHVDSEGRISQPVEALRNSDVSALLVHSNGELWAGTFGDGVYRIRNGSATRFGAAEGLASQHIFALAETDDGDIWIGTASGTHRWSASKPGTVARVEQLADALARHITVGADGRLWLSTSEGLLEYRAGAVRRWTESEGLPSQIVMGTHEDDRGVLWIITRDGSIARLDGEHLFGFSEVDELQSLSAFSILEDRSRHLWIAGATGLMRVSRDRLDALARGEDVELRPRLYGEADGLRSGQFIGGFQPASWASPDDRLWFATARGLSGFDPRRLIDDKPSPRTYIEAVRVNGEAVAIDQPLVLPAVIRSVEIDYSAPELSNADALNFRYTLTGGDSWEEVGDRRTAYFTSIPAGEWVFRVEAQLGDGSFPDAAVNTTVLELQRRPRWYETTWSVLAGCIALALVLIAVQRQLSRHAREREQELRALVAVRTEELSQALKQVEANARIDSLTRIANRRHMDERLAAVWNMAQRSGVPVSIIMVDIDRFKQYNDALGHHEGDRCLKRIANAISDKLVREHDMVARYGGEEFLVMLYDSDEDGARAAAERIVHCVRSLELPHPASDVSTQVTVSVGYATGGPAANQDAYALIEQADRALYESKNGGRNRITGYSPEAQAR